MKVDNLRIIRAAIIVSTVVTGLGIFSTVRAQVPSITGADRSVAFASNRGGNNDVYVMGPSGEPEERVTDDPANTSNDQRPDISPDGSRIVFSSNRDGNFEIFIMNSDGSGVRQLTSTAAPVANSWPRWSPDGEWIAFHSGSGTNFQIFRVRPDGSNLTQVTRAADAALNQFPGWSPDGTKLAIRRGAELYLINASDGSDPVRLTVTDNLPGVINQMAAFSPDGRRIAFMSTRVGNAPSVFVMNVDELVPVNFTEKPMGYTGTWTSRAPDWSPNGEYIYFTGVRSVETGNTNEQIYVKAAAGGVESQLTSTGVNSEAAVRKVHAPTIASVTATPNVLWPPKNQMVPVALTVGVIDNSDPDPTCRITDVTTSETAEDAWLITGPLTLELRAQRSGKGRGQIYTITVTCTNSSQLSSTAQVTVQVPHDQRKLDVSS